MREKTVEPKLNEWCLEDENIHTASAKEYFKMEVGLKYSKQKIAHFETASEKHAQVFLKNFKEPRQLFLSCLNSIASAKTYKLTLALHDARKKKICSTRFKFQNKPVCWTNWRQFVTDADDKSRKAVFDEFVSKVPKISHLIKQNFDVRAKVLQDYGESPLNLYLEEHKLSLAQLKNVLEQLGEGSKKLFSSEWQFFSQKFLKRSPEYYDDFYFMRNKVFEDLVSGFKKINGLREIVKTSKALGFSDKFISVDAVNRPNKYPSPFCTFIKIPTDIRVSYKVENPLNTATAIYHEFGHALHASSINQNLHYWTRTILSDGLCETFSMFFEALLCDEAYLVNHLNLPQDFARELIRRIKFTELYSIAFYVANSFFKIAYWEKSLSFDAANAEYSKQIKRWMNMDLPGEYWQLHHILPEHLMYVPSYMLANIRAYEIKNSLAQKFGVEWWNNLSAGVELRRLMSAGADSDAADFSKLNVKPFLEELAH